MTPMQALQGLQLTCLKQALNGEYCHADPDLVLSQSKPTCRTKMV